MFVFHLTTQEKVSKIQDTEGKRRNVDQYFEKEKSNRKKHTNRRENDNEFHTLIYLARWQLRLIEEQLVSQKANDKVVRFPRSSTNASELNRNKVFQSPSIQGFSTRFVLNQLYCKFIVCRTTISNVFVVSLFVLVSPRKEFKVLKKPSHIWSVSWKILSSVHQKQMRCIITSI